MTFKKYRNKATGEIIEAKQIRLVGIIWRQIVGQIKHLSNNLFNQQYEEVSNNDK